MEQNPQEIIFSQLGSMTDLITCHALEAKDIDSIGITNQRETTIVWDRETGRPIANAIVWQCRRTAPIIADLCSDLAVCDRIELVTGLHPDAYFSASKIKWLLDNVPGARKLAEEGQLLFGTVDCWLIWNLTGRKVHATDVTNASRTRLYKRSKELGADSERYAIVGASHGGWQFSTKKVNDIIDAYMDGIVAANK